jgi:hypothetical protein
MIMMPLINSPKSGQRSQNPGLKEGMKLDWHQRLLSDLTRVGPSKPVGYLPLSAFGKLPIDKKKTIDSLREKGLTVVVLRRSRVASASIYVYDKHTLQPLLDGSRSMLESHGWPDKAAGYIEALHTDRAWDPLLYNFVAMTFGDKRRIKRPFCSIVPLREKAAGIYPYRVMQ